MEEIDLDNYVCECDGRFKKFGRKTFDQYICTQCGLYIRKEKLYKYKINK